jgi:hypothetical protein
MLSQSNINLRNQMKDADARPDRWAINRRGTESFDRRMRLRRVDFESNFQRLCPAGGTPRSVRFLRPLLHFIFHLGYFGPLVMGALDSSFLILPFGPAQNLLQLMRDEL